jgi:PTH1 family peptidyl-tRNA hydrolase
MKLIVGLGNVGREYVDSRHNVGFEVVDRFAAKLGFIAKPADFDRQARSTFDGLLIDGSASLGDGKQERFLLLKPATYMNLSGKAVQAAKGYYQLSNDDLIVIVDDLALPCGTIRVRADGSAGGHNGLRDVERVLGTHVYPRLRVGIDAKPPRMDQKDYVLGRFTEEQRDRIGPALSRAAEALLMWAKDGTTKAANVFNTKANAADESEKKEP